MNAAIERMKRNKATGEHGMEIEAVKYGERRYGRSAIKFGEEKGGQRAERQGWWFR